MLDIGGDLGLIEVIGDSLMSISLPALVKLEPIETDEELLLF